MPCPLALGEQEQTPPRTPLLPTISLNLLQHDSSAFSTLGHLLASRRPPDMAICLFLLAVLWGTIRRRSSSNSISTNSSSFRLNSSNTTAMRLVLHRAAFLQATMHLVDLASYPVTWARLEAAAPGRLLGTAHISGTRR